jgi:hypothetical protein
LRADRPSREVHRDMDEAALLDKLRKIEALFAGATTDGEREAARAAAEKIRARLVDARGREPDVELYYSLHDPWKRLMFIALCRRYGLRPFRQYRQRSTTVGVRAPKSFQEGTLWPEFLQLSKELSEHLRTVTERVIREAIHADASDADEIVDPKQLPSG